jgi:hypothetical protein
VKTGQQRCDLSKPTGEPPEGTGERTMPYWEIFTPENALTDSDKEQLSAAIT